MSWPFNAYDIARLHLEVSNYCNLNCPSCAREERKLHNGDLNSTYLPVEIIKKRITYDVMPGLQDILFCGNIDDPIMHPDIEEIIEYFCQTWPTVRINISTNGAARSVDFWKRLGIISSKYNFTVIFAIDGLENTNHLYRIGAVWNKLIQNVKAFNSISGAKSIWQFVVFNFNKHQLDDIRKIAQNVGCQKVLLRYSGRKEEKHDINVTTMVAQNDQIVCRAYNQIKNIVPSIFINYLGDVTPCCYTDINHKHMYDRIIKHINLDDVKHTIMQNTLHEILEGEFFTFFSWFIFKNKTCELHCKQNITDILIYDKTTD